MAYTSDIPFPVPDIAHTGNISPAPSINAVALSALNPASPGTAPSNYVNKLYGYNPKRYSGKLLRKFYENCVLAKISCTDYIGEIKDYGDSVIIRTTPDIQVKDWTKGLELTYDTYESDVVELTIDKACYWAFVTDPLDQKQTDIKGFVDNWTTDAAKRIDIKIEKQVFAYMYSGVKGAGLATVIAAANRGTTAGRTSASYDLGTEAAPITITTENAIAKINDCGSCMMEQDQSPSEGFWMVIDQKYANILASSELRLSYAMGNGTSLELRGGQNAIPKLDIFDIHLSNILPQVVATEKTSGTAQNTSAVFFGNKQALCFAMQLTKNEVLTNPNSFGLLHRGLAVYGFKVVQPKYLGAMVVKYGDTVPAAKRVTIDGSVSATVANTAAAPVYASAVITNTDDSPVKTKEVTA